MNLIRNGVTEQRVLRCVDGEEGMIREVIKNIRPTIGMAR